MSTIPVGYCQCGCGGKTKLAPRTQTSSGWIKGQPLRYIGCHHLKLSEKPSRKGKPLGARFTPDKFWSRVDRGATDECWEWQASLNSDGYGNCYFRGIVERTHRIAYILEHGEIPHGLVVRHSCDNRKCCNPAHLLLGTHADNVHDRDERHRNNQAKGSANGQARLVEAQVAEIKQCHANGDTMRGLARRFGVNRTTIKRIVSGKGWLHVK